VYVPAQGEKVADATTATTGTTDATSATSQSGQGDSVNLNTATKEQLQTIDGIGDKKADKIIAYRQEHGGFKTVEDLKNVDGFGDKTVAKIKDRLAV
jgi:competence protein ComEA